MRYIVATVLLSGCSSDNELPSYSPGYGVAYYGIAADAALIDEAAYWWLEWGKANSIDPEASYAVLARCTVSVVDGMTLDGVHAGWWHGPGRISVARDAAYGADAHMGLDSWGLMWLRHEWLHELLQDPTHSQFPNP